MALNETPVVVFDACVLFPINLRNVLVQCAIDRLVHARWKDEIHEEWIRNLLKRQPQLDRERLIVTRDKMKAVLPEADVRGYERLVETVALKDPDDRHVLAAAIHSKAGSILSADRGFTNPVLAPYGLKVQRPEDFLMGIYHHDAEALLASLASASRNLRRSLPEPRQFVDALARSGNGKLDRFCAVLERHLDVI